MPAALEAGQRIGWWRRRLRPLSLPMPPRAHTAAGEASVRGSPCASTLSLQLTLLQKLVQQSAATGDGSVLGSLSPLASLPGSLRNSGAPSTTPSFAPVRGSTPLPGQQPAAQQPAEGGGEQQPAEQHWGLARAVDCFR